MFRGGRGSEPPHNHTFQRPRSPAVPTPPGLAGLPQACDPGQDLPGCLLAPRCSPPLGAGLPADRPPAFGRGLPGGLGQRWGTRASERDRPGDA